MRLSGLNICILSALISCAAANANEVNPHWFIGVDVGQGYYSNGGNPEAYDSARHRLAGGAHLGYQFNPYFSTELAYQYLGNANASYDSGSVTGQFHQGVLSASLGYPLFSGQLTPYIKAGGSAWTGDVKGFGTKQSADGFSPVIGAGVSWAINESLRLRFEYQFTDSIGNENTQYANHHLTTVGLSWSFGHTSNKPVVIEVPVVKETIIEKVVEVPVYQKETQVFSSESNALFANDSSVLAAPDAIKPVLNTLKARPDATVTITGYTDNTGSAKYNQWLSEKRAKAVGDYLISNGIESSRITVSGKGMTNPIASNKTEQGRAMNRRVEINIRSAVNAAAE